LYKNNYNIKEWLLRLAILMQNNSKSEINGLKLNSYEERVICFLRTNFYSYYRLNKTSDPVEIVEILDGTLPEEIILLLIMIKSERAKKNIKKYISDLSKIKLAINGFDLQELGLKPGPEIKTVLDKVRAFKLRKIDITKEDELLIAKKIINQIDWSEK
jgi:tRNA nucleotidyltransferase (CCA-adding enzyme)